MNLWRKGGRVNILLNEQHTYFTLADRRSVSSFLFHRKKISLLPNLAALLNYLEWTNEPKEQKILDYEVTCYVGLLKLILKSNK